MTSRPLHSEAVTYTRVRLDPPFDILRARYVRQKFVPHAHDEYAVGVVEQGTGRIEHARGIDVHPAGAVIVIPPGLTHAGAAAGSEGWSYRMFYLPVSYLLRAAMRAGLPSGGPPVFTRVALDDDDLASRLRTLHATLESTASDPQASAQALDDLLHDLVARHADAVEDERATDTTPSSELQAVRTFIDRSFTHPVAIDDLSRLSGLSPYYLIRAFHRAYGIPPYTYVEHLRVQHARQLIESGTTIVEAALQSGFSDQSHLTRRFKRTLGITPGVIARRARHGQHLRPAR